MNAPAYLSVQEAACHLGVSRAFIYQAISNGDLPVVCTGHVLVSELLQFEKHRTRPRLPHHETASKEEKPTPCRAGLSSFTFGPATTINSTFRPPPEASTHEDRTGATMRQYHVRPLPTAARRSWIAPQGSRYLASVRAREDRASPQRARTSRSAALSAFRIKNLQSQERRRDDRDNRDESSKNALHTTISLVPTLDHKEAPSLLPWSASPRWSMRGALRACSRCCRTPHNRR
ncbi:excisionase family DNA binding protein [Deinococcus yavapaiensis KR-236]|uniref:Excisionase family DNA binding protein n=1 Tax=Deinococcus yavapaiensis KR-236 TaxID=694435 RepID=A0A318S850_9DEIO|nr:excisionase family DNA binding protein [Deinococcus yavapaiensis KR-236]